MGACLVPHQARPPKLRKGGVAAHQAWRQRNASVVVRRNINHIGMVVYGVYAIGL